MAREQQNKKKKMHKPGGPLGEGNKPLHITYRTGTVTRTTREIVALHAEQLRILFREGDPDNLPSKNWFGTEYVSFFVSFKPAD